MVHKRTGLPLNKNKERKKSHLVYNSPRNIIHQVSKSVSSRCYDNEVYFHLKVVIHLDVTIYIFNHMEFCLVASSEVGEVWLSTRQD
jgi:hypothetical protein